MQNITLIGIDLGKHTFHVHCQDKSGNTLLRKKFTPDEEKITVRQSKYLNNLIEQDHRNIKRRPRPMLGFKSLRRTQTLLIGIELIHQYHHPQSDGLSSAEQFYLLTAVKNGQHTFC